MTRPTGGSSASSAPRTPSTPECESQTAQRPMQFDMQSLFWLMVTSGIALVQLRPAGQQAVVEAAAVIAIAAALGVIIGTMQNRIGPLVYWSVLGAAFAFISTATVHLAHWTTPYAWAGLGMITGCAVASFVQSRWWHCMLAGGLAAAVVMGLYTAFLGRLTGQWEWFDLACSAPIGAGFGLLAALLSRLHRHSALRYDATATALMAAIVAGNYLSRLVVPVVIIAS